MPRFHLALLCVLTAAFQTACEKAPDGSLRFVGQPKEEDRWKSPEEVTDFDELFRKNCLACHSNGSTVSAALAMDNPVYLSVISEEALRNYIANGVEGKLMPAFAIRNGGPLSDDQIDILVQGILKKREAIAGPLPSYNAPPGNAANGEALFNASFAKGLPVAKTFLDPAFLATVSDQYIRTLVIAGLPDLGYPDFRSFIPGHPLTDQEVSDITAWIISNRKNEFGQPLDAPAPVFAPAAPAVPEPPAAAQAP